MRYEGIATQLSEALENASKEQLREVSKALVEAAKEMVTKARTNLNSNPRGYKTQSLSEGILLGKYRRGNDGTRSITIHAMGDKNKGKTWKARIFVGGAYHRQTRKGYYRGTIEGTDAITRALDQTILDNHISEALK